MLIVKNRIRKAQGKLALMLRNMWTIDVIEIKPKVKHGLPFPHYKLELFVRKCFRGILTKYVRLRRNAFDGYRLVYFV